jgi:cysteine synthase A
MGTGPGFIPAILDTRAYDEAVPITKDESFDTVPARTGHEGFSAGISSRGGGGRHAGAVTPRRASA